MSNLEELQAQLSAAMERITAGVAALDANDKVAELEDTLQKEKAANSILEEQVKALRAEQEEAALAAQAQSQDTRVKVEALDLEMQRLRAANAKLREANTALRDANSAGLAEPDLINSALEAEVESLKAARATDVAEVNAILSALAPVLSELPQTEGELSHA